ncbi:hypothetical protein GXM_02510 [Nostoc sphaeroides CCNUC1]|uniref:Uncharacterized protein n=1 Tax=Nostoc sphaeroides CCNUC1 TaxID=2653204 RepID=A0A5P8VX96_9NOSO|nr:hypothetical protein GXM_02510 [Nostoc sphaeroides CCNUC1]
MFNFGFEILNFRFLLQSKIGISPYQMGTLLYNCVPYRHEIIEFSQIQTSYYSLS